MNSSRTANAITLTSLVFAINNFANSLYIYKTHPVHTFYVKGKYS